MSWNSHSFLSQCHYVTAVIKNIITTYHDNNIMTIDDWIKLLYLNFLLVGNTKLAACTWRDPRCDVFPHANKKKSHRDGEVVQNTRPGLGEGHTQAWDSHLEYSCAVSWEQPSKVNSFFLYTFCMKLSSLLCLSFFLQDDTEHRNKRSAISLVCTV